MTHDVPYGLSIAWILYFNGICFHIILLWFSKWISGFSFHSLKLYLHAKINIFSSLSPSFSHRHTYMHMCSHWYTTYMHTTLTQSVLIQVLCHCLNMTSCGKSPLITYMAINSHCILQSVFTVIFVTTIG